MIAEELLHFIWQFRLFNYSALLSQDNKPIKILQVGQPNKDAGPDFLHAKILIDGREWHGHVELHIQAADWARHKHDCDPAYNAVILHVVWSGDVACYREDGTQLAALSLEPLVDESLFPKYQLLKESMLWIPCEQQIAAVGPMSKLQALQRQTVSRLDYKSERVFSILHETKGDWEQVLFVMMCRAFGMRVNAEPFMRLGSLLNIRFFQLHAADSLRLEAIAFGQSGLLAGATDDPYVQKLAAEFHYQQQVHNLQVMKIEEWRFMRLRPYNFPTFRIAQLTALYAKHPYLFANLVEAESLTDVRVLFENIRSSVFWETHFSFNAVSAKHDTRLTQAFVDNLLINSMIPVIFAYSRSIGDMDLQQRVLNWLDDISPESNSIAKRFNQLGLPIASAADSQGALHLKYEYCDKRRCLECAIGLAVLRI